MHGVSIDAVKSWSSGRSPAPADAIKDLRALWWKIRRTANRAIAAIRESRAAGKGAEVVVGFPTDDAGAQVLGLPSLGAWRAVTAILVAKVETPMRFEALRSGT